MLKRLIAFDVWFRPYVDMKRWFLRLLFWRIIDQPNQKICAQSILLSLNHTHPIQSQMVVHLVIKIARVSKRKRVFLALKMEDHSCSSPFMAATNAR
jgi:hypothetical protein